LRRSKAVTKKYLLLKRIKVMREKPTGAGKSSFDLLDTKKLFSELQLKENTTFLDLACGKGAYSIAASEYIGQNGYIYAVDLWKEGIDHLRMEIESRKIHNIYPNVVDVSQTIPVEDHCIDVCLMATVLHDLIQDHKQKGSLDEVKRVLKHGGTLAVVEFKKIEGPPGPPVKVRISVEEVEEHLRPYALVLRKAAEIGPYNYLAIFTNQHSADSNKEKF